jgi:hypothetical protein
MKEHPSEFFTFSIQHPWLIVALIIAVVVAMAAA